MALDAKTPGGALADKWDRHRFDSKLVNPANRRKYTVIIVGTAEAKRYRIVGEDEADLKQDKISVMSPLARALVGKSEGDAVTVKTPNGNLEYEIEKVEHI